MDESDGFEVEVKTFLDTHKDFICGWGSANCNILVTFPLNKIIFRQMVHNVSMGSALRQISAEGLRNLYRGVLPPLVQKSISLSLMFGLYEKWKVPLRRHYNVYVAKGLAAVAAGTVEVTLVPFERIQCLLQHEKYHAQFKNMKNTLELIYTRYGFTEFYRGLVPILFRNGPSNAVFFILKDELNTRLPLPTTQLGDLLRHFTAGALVGALCSSLFYPLNVLKTHLQSELGGPFRSVISATGEIYRERGVGGFYRGIHLNYTRSCLSWGVINVSYETFKKFLTFDT